MKRFSALLLFGLAVTLVRSGFAQIQSAIPGSINTGSTTPGFLLHFTGIPWGNCLSSQMAENDSNGQIYSCGPLGLWVPAGYPPPYPVAKLPIDVAVSTIVQVTDGQTSTDCSAGGGSTAVLCRWNGIAWVGIGGGSSGVPSAPGAGYLLYSFPGTFAPSWTPNVTCNPTQGTFWTWDSTGSQAGNLNSPNPGPYCAGNGPYVVLNPTAILNNSMAPATNAPVLTANYTNNPLVNPLSIAINGVPKFFLVPFNSSFQVWADSFVSMNANAVNQNGCGSVPVGSAIAGFLLYGCNSGTKKWFSLSDTGVASDYWAGGTVTYTANQTAGIADNGKLVIMNCSSPCAYTLPTTQPSATWAIPGVMSIGSTTATIVLSGGDTFNGSTNVPVLIPFEPIRIHANSATSTDYEGQAPLARSGGVTISATSNALTIGASSTGITAAEWGVNQLAAQTQTGTVFLPINGAINTLQSTEANAQESASKSGTVTGIHVHASANQGAAATLAFTLQKCTPSGSPSACAGSAQTVTCTIGNSLNDCSDNAHSFGFSAGDLLDVKAVQTGTGTSIFLGYTIDYTIP